MKNLQKYNKLWESGQVKTPLVIIISGAAGTGKTVLSYKLMQDIPYANYLTAALIRSILVLFIKEKDNPYLNKHTFDLYKVSDYENEYEKNMLIDRFRKQSKPIIKALQNFLLFIESERQHYIIEGPNAIPSNWKYDKDKLILVEFVMKVSDREMHRKMMGGPTHNRTVTEEKLLSSRILNEFLANEGIRLNKKVIEYNESYKKILEHIDNKIGEYLADNHLL